MDYEYLILIWKAIFIINKYLTMYLFLRFLFLSFCFDVSLIFLFWGLWDFDENNSDNTHFKPCENCLIILDFSISLEEQVYPTKNGCICAISKIGSTCTKTGYKKHQQNNMNKVHTTTNVERNNGIIGRNKQKSLGVFKINNPEFSIVM